MQKKQIEENKIPSLNVIFISTKYEKVTLYKKIIEKITLEIVIACIDKRSTQIKFRSSIKAFDRECSVYVMS